MEQIELKVEVRSMTGKSVKQIRGQGLVPGILYGSQIDTTAIQIDSKTLQKVLSKAGGSTLINLQVGKTDPVPTLAREVQRDVIRHHVTHVDFQQVVMTENITAEIPLRLINEAPAVDELGGILVQGADFVEVQCLPADLPAAIEVDVSGLEQFNEMVSVADLVVSELVTILSDPDTMVARIQPPRLVEEEEEEEVEEGLEEGVEVSVEPEVVGRREKTEGEDEEE